MINRRVKYGLKKTQYVLLVVESPEFLLRILQVHSLSAPFLILSKIPGAVCVSDVCTYAHKYTRVHMCMSMHVGMSVFMICVCVICACVDRIVQAWGGWEPAAGRNSWC